MRAIVPNLWFDTEAEEAAEFYVSVFGGRVTAVSRYGPDSPREEGTVMTAEFELQGQRFTAINGGPQFPFTEAVSFLVPCADQAEVDRYWDALVEDGEPGPCGWLKDRYGLSWQVVPDALGEMMADPDQAKVQRVAQAMLATHGKFDVAALRAAYEGR
jgi:predicted 3-demethylubiquinone-9 3-methyltransferase (glyoxalase superfamily)